MLCVELYCGMFGWSAGWLARGGRAIGFDLEHQPWHGPVPDGAELVLQDVLTLHGAQFADADLIIASPPCQEFSYRAMPWKKAKSLPPPYLGMKLFWRCWQIQAEACEAAGHHIPMVVENVRGAQPWVGRARANYGSYYLWGDVGMVGNQLAVVRDGVLDHRTLKQPRNGHFKIAAPHLWLSDPFQSAAVAGVKGFGGTWFGGNLNPNRNPREFLDWMAHDTESEVKGISADTGADGTDADGTKVPGISWSKYGQPDYKAKSFTGTAAQRLEDGTKIGGDWFSDPASTCCKHGSRSQERKAASALIARIPEPLSNWVAEVLWPQSTNLIRASRSA